MMNLSIPFTDPNDKYSDLYEKYRDKNFDVLTTDNWPAEWNAKTHITEVDFNQHFPNLKVIKVASYNVSPNIKKNWYSWLSLSYRK